MKKEVYSLFASYYDDYMAEVSYDQWVEYVLSEFNMRCSRSPGHILELACGTGNISNRLVRRGFRVTGIDLSEEMLSVGRRKPFAAEFMQGNMLDPIKAGEYDLMVLFFDSINYLLEKKELSRLFGNIKESLADDGLFIFDISTERNCLLNFDQYVNLLDDKRGYLIHEGEYDSRQRIQTNHFTFFLPEDGVYRRYDEYHRQRMYRLETVIKLAEKAGLKTLSVKSLPESSSPSIPPEEYRYADKHWQRIFIVMES